MFKVTFERPKFQIAEEVRRLLARDGRKKKEERKPWTKKERILVGFLLFLTVALSVYFWFKGSGQLPQVNLPKPEFGETILLEK